MINERKKFTFFKGRVALHAILNAAGIGPGDMVLLPGYTCVVVPNAIIYRGAKPVFLDIDQKTFNLDLNVLDKWEPAPSAAKAKAIVVQHTYGIPADMDPILSWARRKNLLVIEDSCHAIGSTYNGQPVGTFGDAAFFSSQWSKPITTGLGGWAVINNRDLLAGMNKILPDYPPPGSLESTLIKLQYLSFKWAFRPRLYWLIQGFYRKMGDLGLAIGSSNAMELSCQEPPDYMKSMGVFQEQQLEELLQGFENNIQRRKDQQSLLEELLQKEGFKSLDLSPNFDPVILRYPVRVGNKKEILRKARQQHVQLGDWFVSPIHPNSGGWKLAGYTAGSCPNAEKVCATTINIPLGPGISDQEIGRTIEFLGRHAKPC